MRRDTSPVGPEELSAYLDRELVEARRATVESHLADDREAAARIAEYRRRDEALRLAFAGLGAGQTGRPTPRIGQARAPGKRPLRLTAAAALLAVILGTAGWWYTSMFREDRTLTGLAREAVTAHLLYAGEGEQGSLVVGDPEQLSARFSAFLGGKVKAPNLSTLGLQLVGLRELPAGKGPGALLIYRDADDREVSCYFRRLTDERETGFTQQAAAGVNVIYRLDEGLGYAVVGALPMRVLRQIAEAGYLQNAGAGQ